jgi:CheY-like chemotaxis protein
MTNSTSVLLEYRDKLEKYSKDISIIYAEDEFVVRDIIERFLLKFFSDVRVAVDGSEALNFYKERPADILVTDITMPIMNGIELCERVREINSEQKIIITSAHNDSDKLMKLIDTNVDSFLLDPISKPPQSYKYCRYL